MDPKICKVCGDEMVKVITNQAAEIYVCTNCMKNSLVKHVIHLSKCPYCDEKTFAELYVNNKVKFYKDLTAGFPIVTHVCLNCGGVEGFNLTEE